MVGFIAFVFCGYWLLHVFCFAEDTKSKEFRAQVRDTLMSVFRREVYKADKERKRRNEALYRKDMERFRYVTAEPGAGGAPTFGVSYPEVAWMTSVEHSGEFDS